MRPALPPTEAPRRRSPWPMAIAIGLGIVVLMNAVFIYVALSNTDPIAPSYSQEHR